MYIFAILQDIQHLPWESIPMLFDRPVTRVPSMQFLLSKVRNKSEINSRKVDCIIVT